MQGDELEGLSEAERINEHIECPMCHTQFVTARNNEIAQCPACNHLGTTPWYDEMQTAEEDDE